MRHLRSLSAEAFLRRGCFWSGGWYGDIAAYRSVSGFQLTRPLSARRSVTISGGMGCARQ